MRKTLKGTELPLKLRKNIYLLIISMTFFWGLEAELWAQNRKSFKKSTLRSLLEKKPELNQRYFGSDHRSLFSWFSELSASDLESLKQGHPSLNIETAVENALGIYPEIFKLSSESEKSNLSHQHFSSVLISQLLNTRFDEYGLPTIGLIKLFLEKTGLSLVEVLLQSYEAVHFMELNADGELYNWVSTELGLAYDTGNTSELLEFAIYFFELDSASIEKQVCRVDRGESLKRERLSHLISEKEYVKKILRQLEIFKNVLKSDPIYSEKYRSIKSHCSQVLSDISRAINAENNNVNIPNSLGVEQSHIETSSEENYITPLIQAPDSYNGSDLCKNKLEEDLQKTTKLFFSQNKEPSISYENICIAGTKVLIFKATIYKSGKIDVNTNFTDDTSRSGD